MIVKTYQLEKINTKINKIFLLYGKNEGHKKEAIKNLTNNRNDILNYEQSEIIDNQNILFDNAYSMSLFEDKKIIIIKRVTDKLLNTIENIDLSKIGDILIILIGEDLEKKSKIRSKFEKSKNHICIPFYPDNDQTLIKFAYNYLREIKITLSSSIINFIIKKSNGDREILLNELKKVEFYCKSGKKITEENIAKLVNLIENHTMSELINCCLTKNKKKITNILNENNFSNEDCILITRTFLNKLKRLLILSDDYKKNNNIDETIASAKPPIFWKDKEITKEQIYKWSPEQIKRLIYSLNKIELLIKKNINISINLILDFILDKQFSEINN